MTEAPSDAAAVLARWTAQLERTPLPVCAQTVLALDAARRDEDCVDANQLGEIIAADPLMTLRLMSHVARLRGSRRSGDPQTVTAALVWLGIGPFFRDFTDLESIEHRLAGHPDLLRDVNRDLAYRRRAARLAHGIAVRRADPNAPGLYQAALLDQCVELLLLVLEPEHARRLPDAGARAGPSDGTPPVHELLGCDPAALQRALNRLWRLSALLERIADLRHEKEFATRTIRIAQRCAGRRDARPDAAALGRSDTTNLPVHGTGADQPTGGDELAELADLLDLDPEAAASVLADLIS